MEALVTYNSKPRESSSFSSVREQILTKTYPRRELAAILEKYNQEIGNGAAVAHWQYKLLQPDCLYVITGQQLGVAGGPLLLILKAITAIKLAAQEGAIPLFWLATEDHDIGEIDHTYVIKSTGDIQKFRLSFPKGGFAEDLLLTDTHIKHFKELLATFNIPAEDWLIPNMRFAEAMARLLASLFRDTPLLFIEPFCLRQLAIPYFKQEILRDREIEQAIALKTNQLAAKQQPTPLNLSGPNLFYKAATGQRVKIRRIAENTYAIGHKQLTASQIATLIEEAPQRFSSSAASRTLIQSTLFPTLAYVAGPTEKLYYSQLEEYHKLLTVPFPQLVSRITATLTLPAAENTLSKLKLSPWEALPASWRELLHLNDNLQRMHTLWQQEQKTTPHSVSKYFQLIAKHTKTNSLHQLQLENSALHFVRNLLHPKMRPQERVINWLQFQAATPNNLIALFIEQIDLSKTEHYFCRIYDHRS